MGKEWDGEKRKLRLLEAEIYCAAIERQLSAESAGTSDFLALRHKFREKAKNEIERKVVTFLCRWVYCGGTGGFARSLLQKSEILPDLPKFTFDLRKGIIALC
jgi:hypothetical protein